DAQFNINFWVADDADGESGLFRAKKG
ncbi:DUF1971 domain-containing protein, partial [Klebsiella michiganensis]